MVLRLDATPTFPELLDEVEAIAACRAGRNRSSEWLPLRGLVGDRDVERVADFGELDFDLSFGMTNRIGDELGRDELRCGDCGLGCPAAEDRPHEAACLRGGFGPVGQTDHGVETRTWPLPITR